MASRLTWGREAAGVTVGERVVVIQIQSLPAEWRVLRCAIRHGRMLQFLRARHTHDLAVLDASVSLDGHLAALGAGEGVLVV